MANILEKIKTKKQEYNNGKKLAQSSYTPDDFVFALRMNIANQKLPHFMQNKKSYHKQNTYGVSREIVNTIKESYYTRVKNLKPYLKETPYNRISHWGALFNVLFDYYATSTNQIGFPVKIHINKDEFQLIPKRYRCALSKAPSGQIENLSKPTNKMSIILESKENLDKFQKLMDEAKKLIDLIYDYNLVSSNYRVKSYGTEQENKYDVYEKGDSYIKPMSDATKSYFVSNEQLAAIKRLQEIFIDISNICLVIQHRTNASDIFAEYMKIKDNKDIVLQGHKFLQSLKASIETNTPAAIYKYRKAKRKSLLNIYEKTNTRIK